MRLGGSDGEHSEQITSMRSHRGIEGFRKLLMVQYGWDWQITVGLENRHLSLRGEQKLDHIELSSSDKDIWTLSMGRMEQVNSLILQMSAHKYTHTHRFREVLPIIKPQFDAPLSTQNFLRTLSLNCVFDSACCLGGKGDGRLFTRVLQALVEETWNRDLLQKESKYSRLWRRLPWHRGQFLEEKVKCISLGPTHWLKMRKTQFLKFPLPTASSFRVG